MRFKLEQWNPLLILSLASYLILTRNPHTLFFATNADLLYFETLYQGLFLQHQPLHFFLLMAAPDWLQMLFYFTLRLFLNMLHTLIILPILSLWLFYFLFMKVVQLICTRPCERRLYQGSVLLGISLLAWTPFWTMDSLDQALGFQDHFFNSAIMGLLGLWLLLRILLTQTHQRLLFPTLGLTVFITTTSDPSYLTCFDLPALCSLAIFYVYLPELRKKIRPCLLLIGITGMLGFLLLRQLSHLGLNINYNHFINPQQRDLAVMFSQIERGLVFFLLHNNALFLLWIGSLFFLFKMNFQQRGLSFIRIFLLSLFIISFATLFLLDPDIDPTTSNRILEQLFFTHNSTVVYLPLFFMSVPILAKYATSTLQKQLARYFKSMILLFQIALFFLISPLFSLSTLFGNPAQNWPWVACIQSAQQQYGLKQGISDYWVSRPVTLYTGLPMVQVDKDLRPSYWLTDIATLQAKTADFVITDTQFLNRSVVIQHYGTPATIVSCPFNGALQLQLLIYPQGIAVNPTAELPSGTPLTLTVK